MLNANVKIEDVNVAKALEGFAEATSNRKQMLEGVGRRLLTRIREGFRSSSDPWGKAWAPPRLRRGQPLRDTGRLANSFVTDSTNDEVQVGTNVCYAVVHQFGATITAGQPTGNNVCGYTPKGAPFLIFRTPGGFARKKQVTIPRRAMLPIRENGQAELPETWAADVVTEIQTHLEAVLRG